MIKRPLYVVALGLDADTYILDVVVSGAEWIPSKKIKEVKKNEVSLPLRCFGNLKCKEVSNEV